MINPETGEPLVNFPCDFLFKITALNKEGFESDLIESLKKIDQNLNQTKITRRFSKNEKYISLSIHLYVERQSQIDETYRLLKENPLVVWSL